MRRINILATAAAVGCWLSDARLEEWQEQAPSTSDGTINHGEPDGYDDDGSGRVRDMWGMYDLFIFELGCYISWDMEGRYEGDGATYEWATDLWHTTRSTCNGVGDSSIVFMVTNGAAYTNGSYIGVSNYGYQYISWFTPYYIYGSELTYYYAGYLDW